MIAHLHGTIAEKINTNSVIIDVHGIGYEVTLTSYDFDQLKLNDTEKIYTHHAIRENSEDLYGFLSLSAKRLFELIISVNGIGPKAGISILSLGPAETVRSAIASADTSFISKAPGIGKKSAERIIVDLKDKVGLPNLYTANTAISAPQSDEALDALIALGFSLKEASEALKSLDPNLPTEQRIKLALKNPSF